MADSRFALGMFWAVTSAFLWATVYVAARHLLADPKVDPLTLATIRFVIGGAALAAWALLTARRQLLAISFRDGLYFAALGLTGVVVMSVLLFVGLKYTTAINSSLISQSSPVFLAMLGILIGERLRALQVLGIAVGLAGCILVVGKFTGGHLNFQTGHFIGDLCIGISAFCWAAYSVAGKGIVRRHGGLVASTWAMVFGAAELLIIWLIAPHTPLAEELGLKIILPHDAASWAIIIYLAIFPAAVAFLAWYEAMNLIPLALLNATQYFTPAFVVILAYVFLGERLTALNAAGMVLILTGTILAGIARQPTRQQ